MRLLSYSVDGTASFGVLHPDDEAVIDLRLRLPRVADLGELITKDLISDARLVADGADPDHALTDITFERLIPWPRKIFCIGVNYEGRNAEYRDGTTDASYPSVFVRFPDSLTGHEQALVRPPESPQLDYEGEIVVVVGRAGRRIPVGAARDHILGLSLGNEGTIRDWVRHARFNVTQGKNWEASGSIGPWLVTMDEIGDLESLHLTTRVNGELRQDETPATMKYPIDYQIHYLSTFTPLAPGDIIFTGTPTGAGARLDPPRWLAPGDEIEVSVPEIGTLRNPVADERIDGPDRPPPPRPR